MSNQPELPFNMEERVAPRDVARKVTRACDHLRKIHLDNIRIRPGFNARRQRGIPEELWEQVLGIPELADGIYASNGPADPIRGDITREGIFYQTDGERRIRAIRRLIRTGREVYPNGNLVTDVLILLNAPGTTDLERKAMVITTNNSLPLRVMDRAYFYLSYQMDDGMTHEEIAKLLNVSRQTVNNYINATKLPVEVQDAIDDGKVNITTALSDARKKKHGEDVVTPEADKPKAPVVDDKHKDGDEDEFEQQDNSVAGVSSRNMPEDKSSGAIVIGKDSIYVQQAKKATLKQFINRYNYLMNEARKLIVADKPSDEEDEEKSVVLYNKREAHVLDRLFNEYDVTVK